MSRCQAQVCEFFEAGIFSCAKGESYRIEELRLPFRDRIIRLYRRSRLDLRWARGREREEKGEKDRSIDRERTYYAHRIVKFHVEKAGEGEGPISGRRTGCVFHHGSIERAEFSRLYEDTKEFALQFDMLCPLDKSEYFRS